MEIAMYGISNFMTPIIHDDHGMMKLSKMDADRVFAEDRRYIESFSYFVASMAAPIASGWSKSCRVRLAPAEKRRLRTAHTPLGDRPT